MKILPPLDLADPAQRRLWETLDAKIFDLLDHVDGVIRIRSAPPKAAAARNRARNNLHHAAHELLNALAYATSDAPEQNHRSAGHGEGNRAAHRRQ